MTSNKFMGALFALALVFPAMVNLDNAHGAENATAAAPAVRFAVISQAEPARIYQEWQPFIDYLAAKTGYRIELVVPRGFDKIKEAIETKDVDIFYINSLVYFRLQQEGKIAPIAQVQNLNGDSTSRAVIVVRSDSGIDTVKQLQGRKIAYVSPMASGAYLAPRAQLYKEGIKGEQQAQELFTNNLTTSLHKVLLGDAAAATMCGVSFKLMSEKINTGELKIIGRSDDFAEDILAGRADLDAKLRDRIAETVLTMPDNAQGKQALARMRDLRVQQFVPYDKKSEQITRKLLLDARL